MLAKLAVFGRLLPAPVQFDTLPVLFYLRSFFTGFPFPMEGVDVIIHPLAFGAWAGLMITGLNLIPAGQLDGGHLLYVLLGKKAGSFLPWIIFGLIVLGLFWPGWFLWAVLVFVFGRVHAEPLDTITPLESAAPGAGLDRLDPFRVDFHPHSAAGFRCLKNSSAT